MPLGDYAGYGNPDGLIDFELATGAHLTYATDYLERSQGWAGMDEAPGASAWSGSGFRLVLGVPILPGVGTLAQGATGAYDQYFATLAKNLVSGGESDAILRLGWEFNGNWFPWSVQTSADAANFVAFWKQIVTTMRAARGEHFTFVWNPNGASPTSYTPDQAYPGNAYVDYVGTDDYDNFWGTPFTPAAAWANQLSQQWGFNWLASFAAPTQSPSPFRSGPTNTVPTATGSVTTRRSWTTWGPGSSPTPWPSPTSGPSTPRRRTGTTSSTGPSRTPWPSSRSTSADPGRHAPGPAAISSAPGLALR